MEKKTFSTLKKEINKINTSSLENIEFQHIEEAHKCIESLKKNEQFDYELSLHDYKKLDDLMNFPTKAFKMGIREKYVTFRPTQGQIVRLNLGITIGSIMQGCKYGVVIQSDCKNKKNPIVLVAPIFGSPMKTSYMVPIIDSMFEFKNKEFSGYIHLDQFRPCSVGSFIADENGNYVYGQLNSFGLHLLRKPMLRLFGFYELLDSLDNRKTKQIRERNLSTRFEEEQLDITTNEVLSLPNESLPVEPALIETNTNISVEPLNIETAATIQIESIEPCAKKSNNSKKNKKKKKQKARKKKR